MRRCSGPILYRALALDPAARFADGVEMERALSSLLGTDGLVRARQAMVAMMSSLFADEKRVEMTPIPDASVPAEIGGASIAALPDAAISPAGALESFPPAELETSVSPASGKSKSGVSGLTLDQPSKSHVRYVRLATTPPAPAPARSPLLIFALGLSVVSIAIAVTLAVMMMHARGLNAPPAATPAPTPAATSTHPTSSRPSSGSHH